MYLSLLQLAVVTPHPKVLYAVEKSVLSSSYAKEDTQG